MTNVSGAGRLAQAGLTTRRLVSGSGVLLVLVSAISFGVMAVLIKLAYEQGINLKTLLALRFGIAAPCMWLIWARQRPGGVPFRVSPGVLLPVIAMGALGYVGQSFSYYTAVGIISASATGLLLYTYPTIVTLLAWVFFRESLTPRKLAALALATLGTLMVLGILSQLLGFGDQALGSLRADGVAWALAASVIYSLYIIAGTRFTAHLDAVFSSAVIITSAALVYLAWALASGELNFAIGPAAYLWAATIALVSTILAIMTFFAGLRLIGPSRASIISTVEPAVTVGSAALVLGERISPEQIAGGLLILVAVLVLQFRSRPRA